MQELVATVLALVLPSPERERQERRTRFDVPFWSLLLGILQLVGAFVYLSDDYLATLPKLATMTFGDGSGEMAAKAVGAGSRDERIAYNLSGALTVWAWWLQPHVLLGVMVALTGGARLIGFAVTRQVVGEPWAYLLVRLGQALRRRQDEGAHRLSLGPVRPDRFLSGEGGEQWLLSARPRLDWQVGHSVEIGGEIFQIAAAELRKPAGESGNVHHYLLRPQPLGQMIRRMVAYEPR